VFVGEFAMTALSEECVSVVLADVATKASVVTGTSATNQLVLVPNVNTGTRRARGKLVIPGVWPGLAARCIVQ